MSQNAVTQKYIVQANAISPSHRQVQNAVTTHSIPQAHAEVSYGIENAASYGRISSWLYCVSRSSTYFSLRHTVYGKYELLPSIDIVNNSGTTVSRMN